MKYKETLDQLGIFGGPPLFSEKLHVGRPNIGDKEKLLKGISEILDRRWLSNNGPVVQSLEARMAALLGVKHCIMVCNATIALEIVIKAMAMSGEVIVPSWTFIATAHALQWQGITPVFCDVSPETHCIDPAQIEKMITPRTSGIIGVHLWGRPCDTDALAEIAARRNLKLLYDASHAFACSHRGTMIGNFGEAEVFSFHATKFLNCFEGGAITTNDDELAGRIRLMKNFGFAGFDNVIYIGTNGKMSEVSAIMGQVGLDCLDEFIETNRRNYMCYSRELNGIPGLSLIRYNSSERNNYQYIVFEVDEEQLGISRNLLLRILQAENVVARKYFFPGCHRMEPYRSHFPNAGLLLPQTEVLANRVLSLPNGTAVDEETIKALCRLMRYAIENAGAINQMLREENVAQLFVAPQTIVKADEKIVAHG